MSDDEFLAAFADGTLTEFHHSDHVRLSWLLIRRLGSERAATVVGEGIRAFAGRHGHTTKYHETLTRFWVSLIAHAAAEDTRLDFADAGGVYPWLFDPSLPLRHWSAGRLWGREARARWLDPDVRPLPFPVVSPV